TKSIRSPGSAPTRCCAGVAGRRGRACCGTPGATSTRPTAATCGQGSGRAPCLEGLLNQPAEARSFPSLQRTTVQVPRLGKTGRTPYTRVILGDIRPRRAARGNIRGISMDRAARLPVLPRVETFPEAGVARGCFEVLDRSSLSAIKVEGWMLAPHVAFTSLEGYVNGRLIGSVEMRDRTDVAETFPWIRHALHSGFRLRVNPGLLRAHALNHLELIGYQDRKPAGRLHTLFRPDLDAVVPTPPAELMVRVAGHADSPSFKLGGLKCY